MTAAPLQVLNRPFAVEPVTQLMLPDGIFDNAIHKLRIACHYTNRSTQPLLNASIHLESVSDPGIVAVAKTFTFLTIPAGASVLVMWDADFMNATPGKRLVSFVARADGFESRRSIRQIFVSQTRYQASTNSYTCTVEEGTLTVSDISAIVPRPTWGDTKDCVCPSPWGPNVPTGMTMAWAPNPIYAGTHGDLPFCDPWWKILAVIIFIIAAIVAIVAAATGGGTASFGGTVEETDPSVSCCDMAEADWTVAGVASVVAGVALAVALSDTADPMWRGQEATPPAAGDLTVGERVEAKWSFPNAPNAGAAYTADVNWTYTRFTTGATYTHAVTETQTNIHVSDGVETETPGKVVAFDPLWVRSKFHKTGGALFTGTDLYAFALFRSPGGLFFVVPMTDDGLGFDQGANDGRYAGELNLEKAYGVLLKSHQTVQGVWRVYVFAQDVNQTQPGTPPQIAAQEIGGFFVASAIHITFDPSLPCPLRADAAIDVV